MYLLTPKQIRPTIIHPDYGRHGVIVANTRANAIAIAEAEHLKQQRNWSPDLEHCSPSPAFTAKKVAEMNGSHFLFSFA